MFARSLTAAALWVALVLPATAQTGTVLMIANEDYARQPDAYGATGVVRTAGRFEANGFETDMATDVSADAMRAALSQLSADLAERPLERVVIVYAGRIVHAAHGTWLMGIDAADPDFASVEAQGLRLESALAVAGARQGGALVVLADYGFPDEALSGPFNAGLPPQLEVPQGVSVVYGDRSAVTPFLRTINAPGTNLGAAVADQRTLTLAGFNPPFLTFLPAGHEPARDTDREAWGAALDADTIEGYQAYLDVWPNGDYADQARAALERLLNTPERIESALGLTRDERRAIQRDLTLLGYEPRGIDGIFGPGTRSAIAAWQVANRYPETSFLTRDQVFELAQQGARRAAQLEEEARQRQIEEERRDRAYWRDTGSGQDEAGLRAYLDRYPNGIFSDVARERLAQMVAAREQRDWEVARHADTIPAYREYLRNWPNGPHADEARARIDDLRIPHDERRAWREAQRVDTLDSYNTYLNAYPNGAFADEARSRMNALRGPDRPHDDSAAARAEEESLRLPQISRMLIERRLVALGLLAPGQADGQFNRATRLAIRDYQQATGQPATGYLTQQMVAQMMAGGILDIFQ